VHLGPVQSQRSKRMRLLAPSMLSTVAGRIICYKGMQRDAGRRKQTQADASRVIEMSQRPAACTVLTKLQKCLQSADVLHASARDCASMLVQEQMSVALADA
jgi:hypothetical protein